MPLLFRVKKKHHGATGAKPDRNQRSLGFLPLVIMFAIYILCTVFADEIGVITSAPGFYRLDQRAPRRGCVIPRPSA